MSTAFACLGCMSQLDAPEVPTDAPEGFRWVTPKVETGDASPRIDPLRARHAETPVWDIRRKPRVLRSRTAILVRCWRDEGACFAENESLAVWGTGESPEKAVAEMLTHIAELYDFYTSLPDGRLTRDAIELKQLFRKLIIEE